MTTESSPASPHQDWKASSPDGASHASDEPSPIKKRKPISFLLGVEAWKRQGRILKHRASFPLLRQVIRSERKQSEKIIPLSQFNTEALQRSLLSHLFILAFTVPATLWAAYTLTKGLAAGIRFDTWFNPWLIQGVPLLIFCAIKSLTSNYSRKLIQAELVRREISPSAVKGE
ncbi:hypothetical protein [Stutzerimonas stutzeri]|uniref:hypothetical protein n=1 Tax=Stutzerimonas stutzeri TaxID=316 RepID=UPI00265CF02C|nr:hypothetical protein [Stutzerimonas stutzeri]MCF6783408.1 hypothetical protein [Stutzerimonas stutzeri]